MNQKKLIELPMLRATKRMLELAAQDELKPRKFYYNSFSFLRTGYQHGRYLRSRIFDGILKVSVFLPEHLRMGARDPAFEIYLDREKGQSLTYDRVAGKWRTAKLDYLPWPSYALNSVDNWISKASSTRIQEYLRGDRGGYEGILDYQLQLREAALKRKYKKETDPWDADMAPIRETPRDWDRWCRKVGIPDNYMFYQYSRRGVKSGFCTYCEQEVPIRGARHNLQGRCPRCRHMVTYKAVGKVSAVHTPDAYIYLMQHYLGGFVIRVFLGSRTYAKQNGWKCETSMREIRRVLYPHGTGTKQVYCWENYKNREIRWIPEDHVYGYSYHHSYWSGDWRGIVYGKTLPSLSGKHLDRTGLPEAIRLLNRIDPEQYLDTLSSRPILEQLVKAGLGGLAQDCMSRRSSWNVSSIVPGIGLAKTLGIDTQEMKRLREQQGGNDFLRWLRYEKAGQKAIPDRTISWFCEHHVKPRDLAFLKGVMSPLQVSNYLRRQMRELNRDCAYVLTTWADYLSMAARLKLDLKSPAVYRVRNVKKRHDELLQFFHNDKQMVLRVGNILQKYPHIEEIMEAIRPKYEFADEHYTVLVPKRIEDIIVEGQVLSHCVGDSDRYWDRIERRESYVLFLRLTAESDKPYYTLEIEPNGTIRQKRTLGDEQKDDILQASQFLKKWQKEITKRLTDDDLELARKSRVLRIQEFEELRRDQVKIRTGKLAGLPLLDILQADLMEAA